MLCWWLPFLRALSVVGIPSRLTATPRVSVSCNVAVSRAARGCPVAGMPHTIGAGKVNLKRIGRCERLGRDSYVGGEILG